MCGDCKRIGDMQLLIPEMLLSDSLNFRWETKRKIIKAVPFRGISLYIEKTFLFYYRVFVLKFPTIS